MQMYQWIVELRVETGDDSITRKWDIPQRLSPTQYNHYIPMFEKRVIIF